MLAFSQPVAVAVSLSDAQSGLAVEKVKKPKAEKGASKRISLDLFKGGMDIEQIARQRNLAKSTIAGHLTSFIVTGEIEVGAFVTEAKREQVISLSRTHPEFTSKNLKEALGDDFSYLEIRAALEYTRMQPGVRPVV
jgi:uncharacterized protein YpbB